VIKYWQKFYDAVKILLMLMLVKRPIQTSRFYKSNKFESNRIDWESSNRLEHH